MDAQKARTRFVGVMNLKFLRSILATIAILLTGCATEYSKASRQYILIPFDRLHPKIQNDIGSILADRSFRVCGHIVARGDWDNPIGLHEFPWGNFFDNRTGNLIAECYATTGKTPCYPKEWTCN